MAVVGIGQPFGQIFEILSNAEKTKKINPEILERLGEAINRFEEFENFWSTNKKIPLKTAFLCYFTSRNSKMILKKMLDKFREAESRKENPKVASESVGLMYSIFEIHEKLQEVKLTGTDISPLKVSRIMELAYSLRQSANQVDMLPTINEELSEFDRSIVEKEFGTLDSSIGARIVYGS
jgi:hypothetical protein